MTESVNETAERLAIVTAERAVRLALANAEKETKQAVDRAVKDALVDRELHDHSEHLKQINGSQQEMARSLAEVVEILQTQAATSAAQAATSAALSKHIREQGFGRIARWKIVTGILALVASYGTMLAIILSSTPS